VIHARDLVLPTGSVLESDPDATVVLIQTPREEADGTDTIGAEGEAAEGGETTDEAAE
jgi:hypothetical protein